MDNWEIYEKSDEKKNDSITLTTNGAIGLPAFFCKTNKIAEFSFVSILFNQIDNAIALKFTKEEEGKKSFKLVKNVAGKGPGGAYIKANRFLDDKAIKYKKEKPTDKSIKYPYKKTTIEGFGEVFMIHLENKNPQEPSVPPAQS